MCFLTHPSCHPQVLVPGEGQLKSHTEADDLLPNLTGTRGERLRKKGDMITQGVSEGDFSVQM